VSTVQRQREDAGQVGVDLGEDHLAGGHVDRVAAGELVHQGTCPLGQLLP
jgi:hypothetical protein